jgi:hypothetical protein
MTFGRVGKKDVYSATKAWAPKGAKLKDALKMAAQAGFGKHSSGSVPDAQAARFFQKLKNKRELEPRVGPDAVPAYSSTTKRLVREAKPQDDSGAAALAQEHLAEKKEILKEAGLKEGAVKKPTTRAEMHVQKVNMELALDKSGVQELGLGLPWEDNATAGYKKDVDAAVSAAERKSAAGEMGLAPGFSVPHPTAPKIERKEEVAPALTKKKKFSKKIEAATDDRQALVPGDPKKVVEWNI